MAAGVGVTSLVQSSTATRLIVASFLGATWPLARRGRDAGRRRRHRADGGGVSFDLSWLSPLLIFVGVVMFISAPERRAGRFGRVLPIGLGFITLALQLIVAPRAADGVAGGARCWWRCPTRCCSTSWSARC